MNMHLFEKLLSDPDARRELLWLRAREKGHDADARAIEDIDPGVVARLRAAGFDVDTTPDEDQRACERFGRMMEERQEQHLERLARAARGSRGL